MKLVFLSNANSLHLREWAEYFARELKHEVAVLTIPPLEKPYHGVEVVPIGHRFSGRKLAWLTLLPRIRRELRRRNPDLFIGYRVVSYGFLASLTGFHPLVLAAQGGDMVWPPDDRLGRFCVRYAVKRADRLNAWSANIKDEMLRYGADPAKIRVLSRGIELENWPGLPEKPPLNPPRIAMTRALLPSYNTIQLVEALPLVREKFPAVQCAIAGAGPERPSLERRASELGLEGTLRFTGYLSRQELFDLLRRSHLYVSTTLTDGLPLSHFEAMAAGLFPVCSDIPANRVWIREGENGLLAPLGDPAALARQIVRALTDHELRERGVADNRALIEREFDRRTNMRLMERDWQELARAGR